MFFGYDPLSSISKKDKIFRTSTESRGPEELGKIAAHTLLLTHFSSVSVVELQQVNVFWVLSSINQSFFKLQVEGLDHY